MNDIFNQFQQDKERIGRGIPSLDRSPDVVLLSGRVAGEGKSYIPQYFLLLSAMRITFVLGRLLVLFL
jgi:hypothetical protein